jgi:hypothetical protein
MLRRLAALASAAVAEAPVEVVPRLFLGGAVAADSVHLLAHLGVTHIVNATEVREASGGGARLDQGAREVVERGKWRRRHPAPRVPNFASARHTRNMRLPASPKTASAGPRPCRSC